MIKQLSVKPFSENTTEDATSMVKWAADMNKVQSNLSDVLNQLKNDTNIADILAKSAPN